LSRGGITRQSTLEGVVALAPDDVWAVGFKYVERFGRQTLVERLPCNNP
jgi:hypothetical protein